MNSTNEQSRNAMNVYKAICAITEEMSKTGISKDGTNQKQGYKFRGIDQVYGALSPLLAKHKLCVLPRVVDRSVTEQTSQSGNVLFYTTLKVEFDFVSADDGSKHTVCTVGEAMDSGDKSSNKAMSAAYKYACFQAFCIPTEGDNDADASTHEVVRNGASKGTVTRNANDYAKRISDASLRDNLSLVRELVIECKQDHDFWANVWGGLSANVKHYIKDNMKDAA